MVSSAKRTTNFGASSLLAVDAGPAVERAFLRVRVRGVGSRRVTSADLRLQVANLLKAGSNVGGRIHAITGCGWDERAVTWNTQPAIDGAVMSTVGPVARGATASFDVRAAVNRDGVYCLAIESPSTDEVQYNSREATAGRPELVVQVTP